MTRDDMRDGGREGTRDPGRERTRPIRVVVVDDSSFIRQVLSAALGSDPEIELVGTAADPYEARTLIRETNPDVVTLDIEMPRMDGLSFLEKIMTLKPTPVVMVSTLTQQGAEATIRALELGAVDYVGKPSGMDGSTLATLGRELLAKVKLAACARVTALRTDHKRPEEMPIPHAGWAKRLIAIGASTGGVERIRDILSVVPAACPPIVITQHMGGNYLASFAGRLDRIAEPTVTLATHGARLRTGQVFIAPGDGHLIVARDGNGLYCRLQEGPPVSGHKPSVDALFESVAVAAKGRAVGVILSGMGRDGARGLLAMRKGGAYTIGEQESSCVVYGMPRVAMELGAVAQELPLAQIPAAMLRALDQPISASEP